MNLSERMLHVADKWQERKYPADAVGGLRGYSAEVAQLESRLLEYTKLADIHEKEIEK